MKSLFSGGRHIFVLLFVFCLALGLTKAYGQQLVVATGSPTGTYSTQLKEIKEFCAPEGLTLVTRNTSGSIENLNLLLTNKVNAAWVQSDLIYRRAKNEDLGQVKTLLAMHPEQLHWIALSNASIKSAGTGIMSKIGIGGSEVAMNEVSQLAGKTVGAWGGSIETAKQVRLDSEVAYNLRELTNFKEAKTLLDDGKIDVILMVGGAPMTDVGGDTSTTTPIPGLSRAYKLLATSPLLAKKLEGAYQPARLSYDNLGASGVPTVSVNALFVTRNYTTAKMQQSLGALRSCVQTKLPEIRETTGTHPSWQTVDANNKGTWAWYNLPTAQLVQMATQPQPSSTVKTKTK